jgi:hypothetical protein
MVWLIFGFYVSPTNQTAALQPCQSANSLMNLIGTVPTGFTLVRRVIFSGDGKSDLLFRKCTGVEALGDGWHQDWCQPD